MSAVFCFACAYCRFMESKSYKDALGMVAGARFEPLRKALQNSGPIVG
jgi:hypothetical protein